MIGLTLQIQNKPKTTSGLVGDFIILESGEYILAENNDYIIIE